MALNKKLVLFLGLAIHVIAAFFSVGYHHCDELFQVFEFAGYKLGINNPSDLPWEFHEQMRSGIQPLIVYAFTKACNTISVFDPFIVAFFIRLTQGLISFFVTVELVKYLEKYLASEKLKHWLLISTLFFWCLPYFHVRFSSENFSATLFVFALIVVLNNLEKKLSLGLIFISGVFLGIAFLSRFQISFFIIGLFAWLIFVKKVNFKPLLIIFIGLIVALCIGVFVDFWLYGNYTLTWWNYLNLNVFMDKASDFGKQPFYFYVVESILQLIPPFSLLIVFSCLFFWKTNRQHIITWITVPFILLHFFVGHKELRFLFPVLNFLPFMFLIFIQTIQNTENKFITFIKKPYLLRFALVTNVVLLVYFTFKPADNNSQALKAIFYNVSGESPILFYEETNPYNNAGALNYFRNKNIKTISLISDTLNLKDTKNVYYFSETLIGQDVVVKGGKKFERIYSNFPRWFLYINFNGWLERSYTFSIYKRA